MQICGPAAYRKITDGMIITKTVGYDILVESILIHLFGLFIKPYIKSIVCLFKTVYIKVVNQHIGKDGA